MNTNALDTCSNCGRLVAPAGSLAEYCTTCEQEARTTDTTDTTDTDTATEDTA